MKFFAIATAVAVAVATTHARECLESELLGMANQGQGLVENVEAACGSTFTSAYSGGSIVVARETFCVNTPCLRAIDAVVKIYPDCEIQGTNYKKVTQEKNEYIQGECKKFLGQSSASAAVMGVSSTLAAAMVGLVLVAHL